MTPSRSRLLDSLRSIVGESHVAADPANRLLHSCDMMTGSVLDRKAGVPPSLPAAVCQPSGTREVQAVVRTAHRLGIPVIPYGGGSGVVGGTLPVRGGILIDLKRLNRIEKIEEDGFRFSAVVQTGIIGAELERGLNAKGFTLGHFPASIDLATLGGYLAARSAGQLSAKYGKIEEMVEEIEVVLPSGNLLPLGRPLPNFPGVRPKDLFVGTEGCLGIITRARLKIHPLPPTTLYRGLSFNRLADGLTAVREILQAGLRPSVVRLYDPLDSLLLKYGLEGTAGPPVAFLLKDLLKRVRQFTAEYPDWIQRILSLVPSDVLLILGFEGEPELAASLEEKALLICRKGISRDLGREPGLHWLKHRYSVNAKRTQIFEEACFVDTFEVAATWDRLLPLYQSIRKVLIRKALVLAHFSHAYPEGCSIYFTFVGRTGTPAGDRRLYDELWREAMEACLKAGGTISHHHGIGILKAPYLGKELGGAMRFYREIKRRIDPKGIMNPGKMGL